MVEGGRGLFFKGRVSSEFHRLLAWIATSKPPKWLVHYIPAWLRGLNVRLMSLPLVWLRNVP